MPFIEAGRRKLIEEGDFLPGAITPGDKCYLHYKKMVTLWKANPRWTTAHNIYKAMRGGSRLSYANNPEGFDNKIAEELAWQVFWQLHVMPYELEKMEQNGDV